MIHKTQELREIFSEKFQFTSSVLKLSQNEFCFLKTINRQYCLDKPGKILLVVQEGRY